MQANFRPLIGLTVGRDLDDPQYLQLRKTYADAVLRARGVPVLIPPMGEDEALYRLLSVLNGVIFPGGYDVAPSEYGEEAHPTTRVDEALDELELAVARWVVQRRVPTLGICRGQQLLNVALGGSLVQDLPSEGVNAHRQKAPRHGLAHAFRVEPASRLARIFGETHFQVNTFHHQAVRAVAPGLRAVAWASDGTIEALESTEHPWLLAVQFHPEDLVGFHEPSQRLFSALVDACAATMADA